MVLDCLNTIETSNNKEVDSTKLRIWGFFSKFYYCKTIFGSNYSPKRVIKPRLQIMKTNLNKISALGLLVTMGIVFGDIGTSPLYLMKAIIGANPNFDADYIVGAVSCVIWTLTLQTTLKYVVIALRADNKGEGGILALFSLLEAPKGEMALFRGRNRCRRSYCRWCDHAGHHCDLGNRRA